MRLLPRVKSVLSADQKPKHTALMWLALIALGLMVFAAENSLVAQERKDGPSAEGERGPRKSAEGEAGARRSAEGERGAVRSAEGARGNALQGFKPQTPREAALLKMVLQLQREVAELRREVRAQGAGRADTVSRDRANSRSSQGDSKGGNDFVLPARWQNTKEGKVFKAYDKNGDQFVTVDEYLAMTNGNVNAARKAIQTKRFNDAEPSGDGKMTPAEFIYWYSIGRHKTVEQNRKAADRNRAGDARDSRNGEGARDGESPRRGSRDGER